MDRTAMRELIAGVSVAPAAYPFARIADSDAFATGQL